MTIYIGQNIAQMRANLESQMLSIESANVSMVAQEGMRVGANAQRLVGQNLNPDEIAELHQDIEDHLNHSNEAMSILAGSYSAGEVFDEDELLAELNAEMGREAAGGEAKPAKIKSTEEDDVETLSRMMANIPAVPEGKPLPVAPKSAIAPVVSGNDDDDDDDLKKLEREMGL